MWQSDVLLGASVGAVTSGLLVALALVVAPMLGGGSRNATPEGATGIANLPGPASAAASADSSEDRAKKERRDSVTRRRDSSALPAAGGAEDTPRRRADTPAEPAATPVPVVPAPPVTRVPVSPAGAAPSAATPAVVQPSAAITSRGLRLRVKAASFGRENGDPELKLTMGITGTSPGGALPPQVTLRLRPDLPSAPEPSQKPLALQANVDVVDQAPGEATPKMGLRVRMALAPATAAEPTVEDVEGDGQSNTVKLAVPLTAFEESAEESIPGVPSEVPGDETPAEETPAEPKPSDGEPSGEGPSDGKPDEPTPAPPVPAPAPAEPAPAPAEPGPAPAPAEPAPAPAPAEPAPSEPAPAPTPVEPVPATPEPPAITVQEIQVPLSVTPEPVTTVEKAVLPLPAEGAPDATPSDGMRITIAVQNAFNEAAGGETAPGDTAPSGRPSTPDTPADGTGAGTAPDTGAADPAPATPDEWVPAGAGDMAPAAYSGSQ